MILDRKQSESNEQKVDRQRSDEDYTIDRKNIR